MKKEREHTYGKDERSEEEGESGWNNGAKEASDHEIGERRRRRETEEEGGSV